MRLFYRNRLRDNGAVLRDGPRLGITWCHSWRFSQDHLIVFTTLNNTNFGWFLRIGPIVFLRNWNWGPWHYSYPGAK